MVKATICVKLKIRMWTGFRVRDGLRTRIMDVDRIMDRVICIVKPTVKVNL